MRHRERIGIFGGTFNPIHRGHVKAAAEVGRRFSLDRVLFVPSFIPPHKQTEDIASPQDRLAMVELALRRFRRLVPSAIEIEARGTSYSIVTLNKVKTLFPGARIFFLLGVDAFLDIETWREWRRVLEQCLFIVMTRPGHRLARAKTVLDGDFDGGIREVGPLDRIREAWFSTDRIFLLPIDAVDVSSTEVRTRVRDGRSLRGLVPPAVEHYIRDRQLYRTTSS